VDLLASSLPKQSTFFIQLSFVSTVSTFLMQGLGLVRIAKGIVRSQVGPNLIERERKNEFLGLYPISNPRNFQYADYQASSVVLLFMIYFVYCVIAPLVSFVTAVCFIMLEILFRHQFVYIYKSKPDSGGRLYMNCISVLTFCLLIAEVTVVGLMSLKKTAAAAFLFPLVAATIIFSIYLRDQHFAVADHLPTRLCLSQDHKNRHTNMEFSTEAYLQPALRDPVAKPNLSKQRLRELEFEDEEEVTEDEVPYGSNASSPDQQTATTRDGIHTDQASAGLQSTDTSNDGVHCRTTRLIIPNSEDLNVVPKQV